MISKVQSSNLAFKGKFELVVPEDQKKRVNKILNGSCSQGLPKEFLEGKLAELRNCTKRLPADDLVRVTLSAKEMEDKHFEQRFDDTPVIGTIKEIFSPIQTTKQTEDNLVINIDYKPGQESQNRGIRDHHDGDHYCSEHLRSMAIYEKCRDDKTGCNGLDVFSFKKNTELYKKMTERFDDLLLLIRGLSRTFKKSETARQSEPAQTAAIDWPDDKSIEQNKNPGKYYTEYVIREFGKPVSDLLGALDPDKKNPEITNLKSKIDEQVALTEKSFREDVGFFKRVISSTLQPEEINLLKKVILEGDFNDKLQVLDRPQSSDVLNIFLAAAQEESPKGPVNKKLFNLLNVGHRARLSAEQLNEIQKFADEKHVNIDPCLHTKGNPHYDEDCEREASGNY
ncbi:MAG: hypothetical protein WC197_04815 [Candidatus Gastranaerophilaceae bacterium]|jgi:hypothetical protein